MVSKAVSLSSSLSIPAIYSLIYITMTNIDYNIATAKKMLSWIVERCYELERQNRKLKRELESKCKQVSYYRQEKKRLSERVIFYLKQYEYWTELTKEELKKEWLLD